MSVKLFQNTKRPAEASLITLSILKERVTEQTIVRNGGDYDKVRVITPVYNAVADYI